MIINTLPLVFRGSVLWVAALIGEEIFDSLQRQMMDDPELQPMVQRLMRIHVTEEARHIQFARDGVRKRAPTMRRLQPAVGGQHQRCGRLLLPLPVHQPGPLPRAGLDARRGTQDGAHQPAPSRGPGRRVRAAGRVPDEVGLMGPIARRGWKRTRFL